MKKLKFLTIVIIALIILCFIISFIFNNNDMNDSIVFIESIGDEFTNNGMGIVYKIDNNINYIVTNYHVIESSDYIYVYNLNNEKERASVLEYDSYTDIAILEIEDNLGLKEAKIGSSSVKVNDEVYYYDVDKKNIGNGSILSLDNEMNISASYGNSFYNAISISANINSGNSGGPIFNSNNEIIGLISLKKENTNIGFYIPIDYVMGMVSKLENHTLKRPNLGGMFANTTNQDILDQYNIKINDISGVVVIDVTKDYPLNISGIIKGDVIAKVNGIVIEDVDDLQKEIYSYEIGDIVTLEYYRDNELNKIDIVLDK